MPQRDILPKTLVMILAGGEGERLYPLTRDRAKSAVPFGGHYRIIDFTLSNCLNSGLRRVHVLTQYKSLSLHRHLRMGWDIFSRELGEFLDIIPPQKRTASVFYKGTADAVFQNIYTLERERPAYVVVLAGDHVYKMNYLDALEYHIAKRADLTVSCIPLPRERARSLGVLEADGEGRILRLVEKSPDPPPMPGRPESSLTSMGVYVFGTETLVRGVSEDAKRRTSHDFARDVIPAMLRRNRVFAYPFRGPAEREDDAREPYWRDIGTVDAYYEANMDLTSPEPLFDLCDPGWPLRTYHEQRPPARFASAPPVGSHSEGRANAPGTVGRGNAPGTAVDSIIASGCVISGGWIERSILSPGVRIHPGSRIESSILMEDVDVGAGAVVRRAIVDKGVKIPENETIGVNPRRDRRRFTVSPGGIVVVPKEMKIG